MNSLANLTCYVTTANAVVTIIALILQTNKVIGSNREPQTLRIIANDIDRRNNLISPRDSAEEVDQWNDVSHGITKTTILVKVGIGSSIAVQEISATRIKRVSVGTCGCRCD